MNSVSILDEGMNVWLAVLLICGGVFIYINSGNDKLERAVRCGCYDRGRISSGQWWRMLTVGFTHIQPWHLAMNLYALYNLRSLESFFGHGWFALILFGSVAGGSLLEYAVSGTRWSVGLSGGLYGLMFSLFLIMIRYHSAAGIRSMMTTLFLNLAINFIPGIAWQAHIGGALTGSALTCIWFMMH